MKELEGPETFLVGKGEVKGLGVHSRDEATGTLELKVVEMVKSM